MDTYTINIKHLLLNNLMVEVEMEAPS